MDREFSWFEGSINWNGVEANVYLETDEEDGDTAEQAMAVLKSVIENIVDNDNKYREFAAQELTGLANEWLSESDESDVEEITQETFAKRMEISEVTVSPDGSLSLIYHDDDMFWGHIIEIVVEPNGEIISANIDRMKKLPVCHSHIGSTCPELLQLNTRRPHSGTPSRKSEKRSPAFFCPK